MYTTALYRAAPLILKRRMTVRRALALLLMLLIPILLWRSFTAEPALVIDQMDDSMMIKRPSNPIPKRPHIAGAASIGKITSDEEVKIPNLPN